MKFLPAVGSLLILTSGAMAGFRDDCDFIQSGNERGYSPFISYACKLGQAPYLKCSTLYLNDCLLNQDGTLVQTNQYASSP